MRTIGHNRRVKGHVAAMAVVLVVATGSTTAVADTGQPPAQVVDSSIDVPETITVGDPFRYRVEIEHSAEAQVDIERPADDSRWSEIERDTETETEPGAQVSTTRAVIDYAVYRPGPTSGPPVSARISTGGDVVSLQLPAFDIAVEPVTEDGESLGTPGGAWPILDEVPFGGWLAGGAGAVVLLSVLIIAIRRRETYDDIEPLAPPEERALQALQRLQNTDLIAGGQFKPFYFRLSNIIRGYLGDRFGFPGTELTTTEITRRLQAITDPDFGAEVEDIARWLQACDRVKFAGHIPAADDADKHLQQAFAIVENTRPRPQTGQSSDDTDNTDDTDASASGQPPKGADTDQETDTDEKSVKTKQSEPA